MEAKKPRRTAERILEVTLDLFNRFGEPNVSTTLISAELHISPGNLYYHYPAKDELINALFDRYEKALNELLQAADNVANVEDAWLFFHMMFELVWQYRFLYRDLNDLLSIGGGLQNLQPRTGRRQTVAAETVATVAQDLVHQRGQRTRQQYRLTEKGADLYPVLVALMKWGVRWLDDRGGPILFDDALDDEAEALDLRDHP